jgi:hypothetical protein
VSYPVTNLFPHAHRLVVLDMNPFILEEEPPNCYASV